MDKTAYLIMIDLSTLLQEEATQNQYIFNFVLMNLIFLVAYINRNKRESIKFTWLLLLVFCLYAFWDTDYFSFRYIFHRELEDFRDPLYTYLGDISFNSYTIFRFLIWGVALYLYKKTSDRFNIPPNISAYIFAFFFLLTFSYARVSLGMAMYFYGISFIIKPNESNKFWSIILGLILIGCSYLGHRSMLALIALTPLAFIQLNRKIFFMIAIAGVVLSGLASTLLDNLVSGTLTISDEFGAAGEAAEHYAGIEIEMEYNWKFNLIRNLRFYSFYIAIAYIIWRVTFSETATYIHSYIRQLSTLSLGILIFAVSFMVLPSWGAEIIGYRYLYMLGIPLCLILAYLITNGYCRNRVLLLILLPAILYGEGFILGKILNL